MLLLFPGKTQNQPYFRAAIKQQLVTPEFGCVMLEWMEQSAASGMPFDYRAIWDHASDLPILLSPPSITMGHVINATTSTTLIYYGFSIPASHSVDQINYHSLASYTPLTSLFYIATSSCHFNTQIHHNTVFFYWKNLHPDTVLIFTHVIYHYHHLLWYNTYMAHIIFDLVQTMVKCLCRNLGFLLHLELRIFKVCLSSVKACKIF